MISRKYGASRAIRCVLCTRSKGVTTMTTVDNPKISPPSGKDEDPKEKGFFNRPRAGGKTMWDWLNLLGILAIPLVVGAATIGFGLLQLHIADVQHQQDQQIALDQQEATTLQTYIDNIQDLLLNHNLLGSKPTDDVAILARARTLTALQGLDRDPDRKARLVRFLYEAHLIGFLDSKNKLQLSIVNLNGADLNHAYLGDATLSGANLSHVFLDGADLYNAKLSGSNLNNSEFFCTDNFDILQCADLSRADLTNAILKGADFTDANLNGAKGITNQELEQETTLLQGTIMPDGSKHP